MNDFEKGQAFQVMEQIKNSPDWMQDYNLIMICKLDPTGEFERFARLLARHNMPTKEIVPCIMEYFQDILKPNNKE